MATYKTMTTLQKSNPVLYRTIISIYMLYVYQRDYKRSGSCFVMLSCQFTVDGFEYVLSLKIENDKMLKDFRRRKRGEKHWNVVSSSTLEKMINN